GGGTPAPEPTGQVQSQPQPASNQHPAAKATSGAAPKKKKKKKDDKDKGAGKTRYASPALRRVAQPGISAPALAKPGPGGLSGLTIEQRTRSVGGGEAMPAGVRSRFEQAFGQDFSDVRIHTGSTQATSVGATAFARGTDIHFAPGRFDVSSQSGLDVLGHELTHIAQQRAGRVAMPQNKGANVNVDRALEAEADLLGARAARGERVNVQGSAAALFARTDTVQYEGGAGETAESEGGTPPTNCELYIAGQKVSARMPAGAQPGEVRVDFSAVSFHGIQFNSARVTFGSDWKPERGTITASVNIGSYVEANDVSLNIERREVGGEVQGHISATITGAQLHVSELFETTIDLTVGSDGISGRAQVDANAPITLGGGITLTSGSLVVNLEADGTLGASGRLEGSIEGLGNVAIEASAMSDGHLTGRVTFELSEPKPIPGIEGVTLESGSISGEYTHGQSWTVSGNLHVNVRDWVAADISASYTHQTGEGGGGGAASSWTLNGHLTQLQAYTIGEGESALNLENGEIDLNFANGAFVSVQAGVDYSTTNWAGHITGTYDVQEQKLNGNADIRLTSESLPLGDTGIRLVSANAQVTLVDNVLTTMTGEAAAIVEYEGQDTFRVEGTGLTIQLPTTSVSGTINMTTLRDLPFGDPAGYNAKVNEGATAQLVVADNALQGITGGLAFDVKHGEEAVGNGTIDVSFTGDNAQLNATGTFELTAENGFGVPDRVNGPVKLLPGGQFVVTIEANALTTAEVRNLTYEINQTDGTGKFGGTVNGSYHFGTGMLNVTGDGSLIEPWTLAPANGIALTFKQGGSINVTVADNVLTQVHGDFEFEATIDAVNDIPQILLDGHLNGDYSQETGFFSGELSATTRENITIPMGEERADALELHQGATVTATVSNSNPGTLTTSFEADYHRAGELFLNGRVEGGTYEFSTGNFNFHADLTLKKQIEKQTDDGKWKFVVLPDATVGVDVAESRLQVLTGSIPFEVHDGEEALFKGSLTDARIEVEQLNFSGTLDVALARDLQYPRTEEGSEAPPEGNPPVAVIAKKDVSHISGTVTNNALTTVTAEMQFGVNLGGEEYGQGQVGGTWDLTQNRFSGTGSIQLVKDLLLGGTERSASGDPMATWILAFPAGQGLDIAIANNVLDEANVNLNGKLYHNEEEVANGQVSGRYKLGDTEGFNGSVNANVIKDLDWSEGDRFHYWIEQGTTFDAQMESNAITSASGTFKLRMDEGGQPAVRVEIAGGYTPGTGFNCGGGITVLNDLVVANEGAYQVLIAKDSAGQATVEGTTVTSFTGDITLLVKKDGGDFAKGVFNITYALADANPMISASGMVELIARVEVGGTDSWGFFVDPSTNVEFQLTNNVPEYVRGQINASAEYNGQQCITGNVTVDAQLGQAPSITANGQIEVTNEIAMGISNSGFDLVIEPGTGANFDVQANALQTIGGTVNVRLDDQTGPLLSVALNGTYTHPSTTFDGSGSITLARTLEVGSNADSTYRYFIQEGTGAEATIAANRLTQIVGNVVATVEDGEGEFLRLSGTVTYRREETQGFVTTTGVTLGVTRDKEMPITGEWKATILTTTNGGITVTDNELVQLNGQLDVQIDKGEDFSGKVSVGGTYTPQGGFTGSGSAELLKDYKLGERAPYQFWALKGGTSVTMDVAASAVTHIGGEAAFKVDENNQPFIEGSATVDYDVTGSNLTLATGHGQLKVDKQLAEFGGFKLVAVAGCEADFRLENNGLKSIGGNIQLRLDEGTSELAHGEVTANWDVETGLFTGHGRVELVRDYGVGAEGLNGHGQPESWGIAIKTGSFLDVQVTDNVFESAEINVDLAAYHNGQQCADGNLHGQYKVGETNFSGSISANVTRRVPLLEGSGRFDYHIDEGTNASGVVTNGAIESIQGTFILMATEGGQDAVAVTVTSNYTPSTGVAGQGTVEVKKDILIKEGGEYKLWLAEGSGGNCTLESSALTHVGGTIDLRVDKGDAEFARGSFTADYTVADGTNANVTGHGSVELVGQIEITPAGGVAGFNVFLTAGTGVSCQVDNGELSWIEGTVNADINYEGSKLAEATLTGKYTANPEANFDASGSITTVREQEIVTVSGWTLFLGEGAAITGSVKHFALDELTANIPLVLKKNAEAYVNVSLTGSYKHADKNFTGNGQADVVKAIPVSEAAGPDGYSFYVEVGTTAHGNVTNNELTELSGTVIASVADAPSEDGKFLLATGSLTYTSANGGDISGSAHVEVTRDKKLVDTANGYAAILSQPTSATVTITNKALESISGEVFVKIDKPEGTPFATISLHGDYTPAGGFSGGGEGELKAEVEVASMNVGEDTYKLFLMPGTGAHITLAASDITEVGGSVEAMIRDPADFIAIHATGVTYDFPGKNFSGSGSAEVLHDKKLATFAGQELWLAEGAGVNATVTNNALQQVGGNITLKLKDEEDFYLTCNLEGTFDAAGGTGFSGSGSVTVTRLKKLAQLGNYSFWLDEGAGASATIAQNKLTKVTGNVPFQVHDEVGCLLEGSAEGTYDAESKKFSGSGDVHLGRDVEYQVGSIKLVFKQGSGGNGTVTDNELKKLGGTLNVDIHDASGPMINVNASGEFDAVEKKILWVEGGATLLRPIEVGGTGDNALIRITTLTGSARVENNELKWCKGGMDFEAPRLMNMTGHVEGGWEATGGDDVFYGSGWVNFTIFDEPSQGRYMKGKCDFTYNKDATWSLGGEVDYQLNPMIGGKVNVTCDQTLDPVIGGELRVTNVKLIEGRDLFKWEKEFPLLQTTIMAGPVPIDMSGGVVVGLNLAMLPLTFSTVIGFQGWHPLTAATKVPDFQARADLNTGVRFTAALKPYLAIGLGVSGVASAGLRLQGEIGLNVDVGVNPFAELEGKGGEYFGKVGIGLSVVGSGSLGITPQLYAQLLGQSWTYDLTNITHDLGNLFSLDYNFAFPFGDNPGSPEEGGGGAAAPTAAPAQTTKTAGAESRPPMPAETSGAAKKPGAVPGGPDLNQADKGDSEKSKQDGPMGELMQKIDEVQAWGAKIGAVAKVGGELVSILTFMITIPPPFGIAVAGIYLAYKIISGGLTLEDITTAAKTVWELIEQLAASAMSLLPDWLVALWNQIKGKSLDDLICDLIDNAAKWLTDRFPSAGPVIEVFADMGKTLVKTAAKLIRAIVAGTFGFDDFIDLCREFGGAMLGAIAELVGEAVVGAVEDAAEAVYDFVTDPPW
ncbi:MAG: DUF4157 domain-containing protein, partial [Myxococcales bacterium]|nr:DUF4157 domain-containing protein [Myxococcales bacterium]